MTNKNKYEESEQFVARHYKPGAFSSASAWRRMGLSGHSFRIGRWRAVAAASVLAVLTVSACIYFTKTAINEPKVAAPTQTVQQPKHTSAATAEVKVIEFDDAPLADVVAKIEETYGVKIGNIPSEDYRLTLRYEGTAADLIATINDILDTNLTIAQ